MRRRSALVLVAALAAALLAVPAASARPAGGGLLGGLLGGLGGLLGGNCQSGGSQVFAPWGDLNDYWLIPNGGVELGSWGWTLDGGASVVRGNEPFLPTGWHSLSLPSGSSATTGKICIGPNNPYVRFFAGDEGGTDAGLHVRVIWYGLLNNVLGLTDMDTYAGGSDWAPQSQLRSSGGVNVLLPLLGSTSARIEFMPLGSGSNWQVDDVYVDPMLGRVGR